MGLTLREGNREYFYQHLDQDFPGLKEKYMRTYGNAYVCSSPNEKQLTALLKETCKAHGILHDTKEVFSYLHTFEEKNVPTQLSLFD